MNVYDVYDIYVYVCVYILEDILKDDEENKQIMMEIEIKYSNTPIHLFYDCSERKKMENGKEEEEEGDGEEKLKSRRHKKLALKVISSSPPSPSPSNSYSFFFCIFISLSFVLIIAFRVIVE